MAHDASHDHDAAHGHAVHHPGDKGAAFVGLFAGAVLLGGFLFGMVKWTNHHLAEEGGKPAAAEATK